MSLQEAEELARELAGQVEQSGRRPDLVIGIANGGLHPAFFVARALDLPLLVYRAQRQTSRIKQRLAFARKALSSRILRRPIYLLNTYADRWFTAVGTGKSFEGNVARKRILVIDDCVDSGATVAHVRSILQERGVGDIKLAVLCWTTKYDSAELHQVVPDYYLDRVLHSYPWSADNPEFEAFRAWVHDHRDRF